jgi:hypothetical protein
VSAGTGQARAGEAGATGLNGAQDGAEEVVKAVREAVRAEFDEVVPYVVRALNRNDAFAAFEDRLKAAEKRIEARRERPVVVGVHRVLDRVRHLDFEPAVKRALEDDLVDLLTEAGYAETGDVGEAYDPARHDALDGRAVDGNAVVATVLTRGLTSFGEVVFRAKVEISPGRPSL